MSVNTVLILLGTVFALCMLAAAFWALTRTNDRIQLTTVCLFASSLGYGALAASLTSRGTEGLPFGALAGGYALLLYIVMAVLAISFKRWAWQAAIAAFGIQLLLALLGVGNALSHGTLGVVGLGLWLALAGIGLWACLHPGSRQLVVARSGGT